MVDAQVGGEYLNKTNVGRNLIPDWRSEKSKEGERAER